MLLGTGFLSGCTIDASTARAGEAGRDQLWPGPLSMLYSVCWVTEWRESVLTGAGWTLHQTSYGPKDQTKREKAPLSPLRNAQSSGGSKLCSSRILEFAVQYKGACGVWDMEVRSMAAMRPEGLLPSACRRPRGHWSKGRGECCQKTNREELGSYSCVRGAQALGFVSLSLFIC